MLRDLQIRKSQESSTVYHCLLVMWRRFSPTRFSAEFLIALQCSLDTGQQAQYRVACAVPHIAKLRLNYSFGSCRNGMKTAAGHHLLSPGPTTCLTEPCSALLGSGHNVCSGLPCTASWVLLPSAYKSLSVWALNWNLNLNQFWLR